MKKKKELKKLCKWNHIKYSKDHKKYEKIKILVIIYNT